MTAPRRAPTREERNAERRARKLNTCKHWNGMLGEPPCDKRIDLPKRVGPQRVAAGWCNAIPCVPNADPAFICGMKETPTVEQVDALEREHFEGAALTLRVMASIPPGGKGSSGEVPCPKCGGFVRWRRSAYNAHLSGSCPAGCVAFMQ